mmetsp:Transcript_6739/g.17609  ORF Transcript_6739/g.17609 Transcript_6739/m.17609 type:complete len:271 (-) Transcript_6739:699-1511(-)
MPGRCGPPAESVCSDAESAWASAYMLRSSRSPTRPETRRTSSANSSIDRTPSPLPSAARKRPESSREERARSSAARSAVSARRASRSTPRPSSDDAAELVAREAREGLRTPGKGASNSAGSAAGCAPDSLGGADAARSPLSAGSAVAAATSAWRICSNSEAGACEKVLVSTRIASGACTRHSASLAPDHSLARTGLPSASSTAASVRNIATAAGGEMGSQRPQRRPKSAALLLDSRWLCSEAASAPVAASARRCVRWRTTCCCGTKSAKA